MIFKNFVQKTYEKWIKSNSDRFIYPPWISESTKDAFTLKFAGIAPELTCRFDNYGQVNVLIHDNQGTYWDIIKDFDIYEKQTSDGKYYCDLCKNPNYYSTRSSLWEDHVFEPIIKWINKFNTDTWIYLYGIPEESVWGASIININAIKKLKKYNRCFPTVIQQNRE